MKCVVCIKFNRDRKASELMDMYKKLGTTKHFRYKLPKLPLHPAERDDLAISVSHEADFIENGKSVCFCHSDVSTMSAGELDK